METVIHSADAFAPVGYLRFTQMHAEVKRQVRFRFITALLAWQVFTVLPSKRNTSDWTNNEWRLVLQKTGSLLFVSTVSSVMMCVSRVWGYKNTSPEKETPSVTRSLRHADWCHLTWAPAGRGVCPELMLFLWSIINWIIIRPTADDSRKACEIFTRAVFLRCDGFTDSARDVSVCRVPQDCAGRPMALCKCPCQNTIDRMKEELKSAGEDPDVLEDCPSDAESCCEEETPGQIIHTSYHLIPHHPNTDDFHETTAVCHKHFWGFSFQLLSLKYINARTSQESYLEFCVLMY